MNTTLKIAAIVVISFGLYFYIDDIYFRDVRGWIDGFIGQRGISHIVAYIVFGIPLFVGAALIHGKHFLKSLGLDGSFLTGMVAALAFTLPMFIGFSFVFKFNTELSLDTILIGVVAAAFFEELYFRGFLFGQLFRFTRLGFIPSVLLGALLFGFVHLYQSQDVSVLVGIFAMTFLGAIWFAWVYVEWNYNIWVPVFLHLFMNLAWDLFSVSDNALGDGYANIFRWITVGATIAFTVMYKRRKGLKLEVNRKTIWMKKKNESTA